MVQPVPQQWQTPCQLEGLARCWRCGDSRLAEEQEVSPSSPAGRQLGSTELCGCSTAADGECSASPGSWQLSQALCRFR